MDLNWVFFPKPTPQYTYEKYSKDLIFVKSKDRQVPCLINQHQAGTSTWLIYFHGNAEDLDYANYFLSVIQLESDVPFNYCAVEYPGYGLYKNAEPDATIIEEDAQAVYDFISHQKDRKIILFGRSMGSGPACFLAMQNKAKALILMSAYSSIRNVAKDHASVLSFLVSERFENAKRADKIFIPTLLIHGKADTLIKCQHSQDIYDNLKIPENQKMKYFPEGMTHNEFDFYVDIIYPFREFFKRISL